MILILDTDHLTVIQRQTEPAYSNLRGRLQSYSDDVCTTIVSFEEQMRGWLSVIAGAKNAEKEIAAYERLHALLSFFGQIPVLDYDDAAAKQFAELRRLKLRIGSMDMKIAAISLSQNGLLLSRNLVDFQQAPGLKVEDWTK